VKPKFNLTMHADCCFDDRLRPCRLQKSVIVESIVLQGGVSDERDSDGEESNSDRINSQDHRWLCTP